MSERTLLIVDYRTSEGSFCKEGRWNVDERAFESLIINMCFHRRKGETESAKLIHRIITIWFRWYWVNLSGHGWHYIVSNKVSIATNDLPVGLPPYNSTVIITLGPGCLTCFGDNLQTFEVFSFWLWPQAVLLPSPSSYELSFRTGNLKRLTAATAESKRRLEGMKRLNAVTADSRRRLAELSVRQG